MAENKHMNIVQQLIEFENSSDVLKYRFKHKEMFIWPLFRPLLFRQAISDVMEADNPLVQKLGEKRKKGALLFQPYYRYIQKNCYKVPPKNIVFLLDNVGHIKNKEGLYGNRVYDFYAKLVPKDLIVLERTITQEDRRKRSISNIAFTDMIEDRIALISKVKKPTAEDRKSIRQFIDYLKEAFPFQIKERLYEELETLALIYSIKLPLYEKYYHKLWKKINPRIVFVQQACYGFTMSCITKQLHDMGIVVAELQHGYIGENHDDYHYADSIVNNPEYQTYFPDYLLTYGEYWGRHIHVPAKTYVVGEQNWINGYHPEAYDKLDLFPHTILFATGLLHDKYQKTIQTLLEQLDDRFGIVIKIHPGRVKEADLYAQFHNHPRVKIVGAVNVYQYLAQSDFVIGDISTMLVEAKAMGKAVYIYEGAYARRVMNEDIGSFFPSDEELVKWLKDDFFTNFNEETETYFAKNCDEKFLEFINQIPTTNP